MVAARDGYLGSHTAEFDRISFYHFEMSFSLTHIHIALQFFDAHRAVAAALGLTADDSLVAGFPVNE